MVDWAKGNIMTWNNYKSKYGAKKIEIDGIIFDSKKEGRRYQELKMLQKAGEISNLQRQVKYILIPAQREPDTEGPRGGKIKGKLLERECSYIADFVYKDVYTGEWVIEDTKGFRTPEYKIKRKMMLYFHNIRIKEV